MDHTPSCTRRRALVTRATRRWYASIAHVVGVGIVFSLVLGIGAAVAPTSALADDEPPKTVVFPPFEGEKGYRFHREAYRALEDAGQTVPEKDDVYAFLDASDLDMSKARDRVALARKFDAHIVVRGEVETGSRKWNVWVRIYNGADGQQIGDKLKFRGRYGKLRDRIRDTFWGRTRDLLAEGTLPSDEPIESADSADTNDDSGTTGDADARDDGETAEATGDDTPDDTTTGSTETAAESGAEAGASATADWEPGDDGISQPLEIAVGMRGFNRTFEYNDDLNQSLRPYTLGFGPAADIRVAWFPGGHATDGIGQWFGLTGDFHFAFAIDSVTEDGDSAYPTDHLSWAVGARFRVPFELSEIALDVGFGQESFEIQDAGTVERPLIPNVSYTNVRVGASGRLGFNWRNALLASLGYLAVLDAGEIQSDAFFPHSDVNGIYAEIGYSFAVIPELELRVTGDWTHYWFVMNPEVEDPIFAENGSVAGGARDDYIGVTFHLVYRLFQDVR